MYTKQEIILKSHREGKSIRRIARELGIHRKTVTRYIKQIETQLTEGPSTPETVIGQQLSTPPKYDASGRSKKKLTPQVTKMIDSLLSENERKRQQGLRKQLLKKSDIHGHLRTRE